MSIKAVFFDIGETLIDESRIWAGWADWLGLSHLAFFATLGSLIERGESHMQVFEMIKPGFNLDREEAARAAAGHPNTFGPEDLYPDALPCLASLKQAGVFVGVAGNQPAWAEPLLLELKLPADFIGISARLGATKPSVAFFHRLADAARLPVEQIAYVGDRVDNDVMPARAAGMISVFLRRGPWGIIQAGRPEAAQAHIVIDSLDELPGAVSTA